MGFSAAWLALREPADHAARDAGLLAKAAQIVARSPVVVDLGCGTGSTRRAFGHLIDPATTWRMVDGDPDLLAIAEGEGHCLDLNRVADLPLAGAGLVTASALIDLVSEAWLDALLDRVLALHLPFYAALSYDGVMEWTPSLSADAQVTEAFNRHQRGDKGFGLALGPAATAYAANRLRNAGYAVMVADSAWQLGPAQQDLQTKLLDGIAQAASEAGFAGDAGGWAQARKALLGQGFYRIGHQDLLALPRATADGRPGSGVQNVSR